MLYNKPSPSLLAQKEKHLFLTRIPVGWLPLHWGGLDTGHQLSLQVGISHVTSHVSNFLQQQLFRASSSHRGLQTSSVQPNNTNTFKVSVCDILLPKMCYVAKSKVGRVGEICSLPKQRGSEVNIYTYIFYQVSGQWNPSENLGDCVKAFVFLIKGINVTSNTSNPFLLVLSADMMHGAVSAIQ